MKKIGNSRKDKTNNPAKKINKLREEIKMSMMRNINKSNKENIEFLLKRL